MAFSIFVAWFSEHFPKIFKFIWLNCSTFYWISKLFLRILYLKFPENNVERILSHFSFFFQLDGKLVEPKVAVPRKTNPKLVMRTKKIFVGGLSSTTSLEDIRAYFDQFSKVKEAMLAYDKVTNRHRGFGFVTFDNEDVVDKICEIHFHEINGNDNYYL